MDTTYEAGVKLTLDTAAAEGAASRFQKTMHLTKSAVEGLNEKLNRGRERLLGFTAAQIGVGLGLGEMVKHSYEANIEMGKLQESMAGALVGFTNWNKGVDAVTKVKASMRSAKETLEEFEKTEMRLDVPVAELAGAYRNLAGPALQKFGMNAKETAEMTENLAGASKVLGMDITTAGMHLTRLLEMRSLRGIDPLTNFFRSAGLEGKKLQKMEPHKLIGLLSEKMKELGPAAEVMSEGMSGTMNRMKNFINNTIRDVGGPAFQYIAQMTERFRKHLEQSVGPGKTLADVYGQQIVEALKSIVGFAQTLADNWKTIALVIGGIKLGGMISSIADMTKGLWGAVTAARALGAAKGIGGAAGGIGGIALGGAAALAGAAVIGLSEATGANERAEIGSRIAPRLEAAGTDIFSVFKNSGTQQQKERAAYLLAGMGVLDEKGRIKPDFAFGLESASQDYIDKLSKIMGVTGDFKPTQIAEKFGRLYSRALGSYEGLNIARGGLPQAGEGASPPTTDIAKLSTQKPPKMELHGNIYINQKFEDADPDNVYVRLKEDIHREANAKTQHDYPATES